MKKVAKVNYPTKKARLMLEDLGDVSEPERCSMYEVLLNNLKIANRATFLHRIIYVGAHKFTSFDEAKDLFFSIITTCNETFCIEKLTGFLLYYNQYIVHMVEGDEDNLNKHLKYLLDKSAEHYQYLGTIKLLIHVSNINQRFFENWETYTGAPSKLLEKLDINADLQQSGRNIYNCIKKLYALMGMHAEDIQTSAETDPDKKKYFSGVSSIDFPVDTSRGYPSFSYSSMEAGSVDASIKEFKLFLPEYEILEFIIHSNFTMQLQEYFDFYGNVPMRDIYKDKVWPVPHDFIPFDVFEKPYDCITEIPKEFRRKYDGEVPPSSDIGQSQTSSIGTSIFKQPDNAQLDEGTSAITKEDNSESIIQDDNLPLSQTDE